MCWYCGTLIDYSDPIGRSLKCSGCGKDLRSCKNCRHLRPSGCNESMAEKPSDTERANFCDWFSLNREKRDAAKDNQNSAGKAAKTAFDELFK